MTTFILRCHLLDILSITRNIIIFFFKPQAIDALRTATNIRQLNYYHNFEMRKRNLNRLLQTDTSHLKLLYFFSMNLILKYLISFALLVCSIDSALGLAVSYGKIVLDPTIDNYYYPKLDAPFIKCLKTMEPLFSYPFPACKRGNYTIRLNVHISLQKDETRKLLASGRPSAAMLYKKTRYPIGMTRVMFNRSETNMEDVIKLRFNMDTDWYTGLDGKPGRGAI